MSNAEATIREMAKLTMLSNKISEVQEKNLKMFPFAFFEGLRSATIFYDFSSNAVVDTEENATDLTLNYKFKKSDTAHFVANYHLNINEQVSNPHLEKRFVALENAVRTLFWKQVRVEIYFNNKKVFESSHE